MTLSDVRNRIRRLKALIDGFNVELVAVAIDCSPLRPAEAQLYRERIGDAVKALDSAKYALEAAMWRHPPDGPLRKR